jgi:hypothetical protein
MKSKVVLITGAPTGIGNAAARASMTWRLWQLSVSPKAGVLVRDTRRGQHPVTTIERFTSGAYEIESWREEGVLRVPPQVEGRFLLVNGTITTILCNRSANRTIVTSVLLGTYTLSETCFQYVYSDNSIIYEGPAGITVSHDPLWEGQRVFDIEAKDQRVFFRSRTGQQEFAFSASGISYSEGGEELRVWRRASMVGSAS